MENYKEMLERLTAEESRVIPEGTKIKIHCHVGIAGMDRSDAYVLTSDFTVKELDHLAWEIALQHAEAYGYYPPEGGEDSEEDTDDEGGVSTSIEGSWCLWEDKFSGECTYGNSELVFQEV